jgi:hypothetical protein
MSEKKIVVPEGMLEAALDGLGIEIIKARRQYVKDTLEAALHWLSENPIVPTEKQIADLAKTMPYEDSGNGNVLAVAVVEWQRRMFLAPEPEDDPRGAVSRLFHKLWTASVGIEGYDKDQWSKMDTLLHRAMYPIAPSPEPDAPETEIGQAANRVILNIKGCTFTPAEADAIVEELSHVAHRWDRRGR